MATKRVQLTLTCRLSDNNSTDDAVDEELFENFRKALEELARDGRFSRLETEIDLL